MTTNHNHLDYQARLDFVQGLLRTEFGIETDAELIPISYEPDFQYTYNNFVYRTTLQKPITSDQTRKGPANRPGCVEVPDGTREFIVRLSNPNAVGMYRENRVENEVAMMSLAAGALKDFQPHVVPSVYAWGSVAAESSYGWTIQELMPGASLNEVFPSMEIEQKKQILGQLAKILKALQSCQLPETITAFGGLTFDDNGQIISAPLPTVGKGPWPSFEASFRTRIEGELREADTNPLVQGWRANGVRDRLDAFLERGFSSQFESLEAKEHKSIVHADFNPSNFLFDSSTHRITALIDYDFSSILHPCSEFLWSFKGLGGELRGWSGEKGGEQAALSEAKLYGFPSPLPKSTKDGVDWELAKALEEELEKFDVKRPRTMKGIEKVADVNAIYLSVLPWRLCDPAALRRQSEEIIRHRGEVEEQLAKLLEHVGF